MTNFSLFSFLLWCTIINYIVLLVWFAGIVLAHDFVYRLHSRWFNISPEQYDRIMYGAMALYKIGILLFNLVPMVVLWIMGRTQ
jgi:hypothetical protein